MAKDVYLGLHPLNGGEKFWAAPVNTLGPELFIADAIWLRCPNAHDVKPAAARITHEFIETRPLGLGPADSVGVLMNNLIPALAGQFPEVMKLTSGCWSTVLTLI